MCWFNYTEKEFCVENHLTWEAAYGQTDLLDSVLKEGRLLGTNDLPGSHNTPRCGSPWEPDRPPQSSPVNSQVQVYTDYIQTVY